ncbi:beta-lactamase/transpeptidase-like protein [Fomitopsis serialis]|uniref:beta-lactamase/transpeptidase-like protein n=1 Tax=Fomitopsis serialis TaxID=139415 RepID=UPI002008CEDE|nr:beta-lactamase/transpeptidase-like protein [Neoantrodia serialis]KAH9937142.1 beta-lactamase/transpeptidase-like protein [Neoantrodia serialis]
MFGVQALSTTVSALAATFVQYGRHWTAEVAFKTTPASLNCYPFLPDLFQESPPSASHPLMQEAAAKVDAYLRDRFQSGGGDIESISVAVVTSQARNNGSDADRESSPLTSSHAMYRMASVSKLFEAVEAHVLKQRGALSWDDPVSKYLPDFAYRLDGYSPDNAGPFLEEEPITLRHLATHMSGLGHDWPPGDVSQWPSSVDGAGAPPTNGLPFPTIDAVLDSVAINRLVYPPGLYPSYSNAATGVLGPALVAANRLASSDPSGEPTQYADIVKRDVFDPMALNGSHFLATEENKHLLVVPSFETSIVDFDFLDAMNAAGGQWCSLSDAITFTSTLLNPRHPKSVLTPYSMRNWLHATHSFEEDDWTELGLIWEIIKAMDSNHRLRRIYWKLVNYHSAIAIHPGTSYGVVVFMAGAYMDAAQITYHIFEIVQPYVDRALAELATAMYVGHWRSSDGDSSATITVDPCANGTNAMDTFNAFNGPPEVVQGKRKKRFALRPTGRRDELRLDTGTPPLLCVLGRDDDWGMHHGAPTNLVYFTGSTEGWEQGRMEQRTLHVPAMGDLQMRRSD